MYVFGTKCSYFVVLIVVSTTKFEVIKLNSVFIVLLSVRNFFQSLHTGRHIIKRINYNKVNIKKKKKYHYKFLYSANHCTLGK